MPTTSDAVQPHKPSRTNSMGVLAVFSVAVSITIECREVADPTYRSLSVQFTAASIIVAFRYLVDRSSLGDMIPFDAFPGLKRWAKFSRPCRAMISLAPVIRHRLGMNQYAEQLR